MRTVSVSAAVLATAGLLSAQAFTGNAPTIVTTNGIPVGLDSDSTGELFFTDIGTNDEVGTTSVGGVISFQTNVSVNSGNPIGITTDGNNIFVTDTTGQDVDIYDLTYAYVSSFSVAAETTFPEGICWNPATNNLYVVDGTASNVHEYDITGTFVQSFPVNGSSVDGIAWDARTNSYWVYDSGTDTIREYSSAFAETRNAPGTGAQGLANGEGVGLIGNLLYVMATGTDQIAEFDTDAVFASTGTFGQGCPTPPDFYEQFIAVGSNDLSGLSMTLTPNGGGWTVFPCPANCFETNLITNLNMADDDLRVGELLGFSTNIPGVGMVSSVDIDSNGRLGWGLTGSDFTESVPEFISQNILAPSWDDYNPAAGGGVYADQFPAGAGQPGRFVVTWDQVPQFGNTDVNTFQVQFIDNGDIIVSWQQLADDAITGFSSASNIDPGSSDLSAQIPMGFSTGTGIPVSLTAVNRPILGANFDLLVGNIQGTAASASVLIGSAQTNVMFPGLLPAGCTLLTNADVGGIAVNLGTGAAQLTVPNMMNLEGVTAILQAVVIDPGAGTFIPAYLSNGLTATVGSL